MAKHIISGILRGVINGLFILIEVKHMEKKYPLRCDLSLEWINSHIGKAIICIVTDGEVSEVTELATMRR